MDAEQPDYDLDSEDETFVNKLKKKMEITALQFEEMIDRLEKGSGQQVFISLCGKETLVCMLFASLALLTQTEILVLTLSFSQSKGGS